jgi:hypothetical protein
MLTFASTPDSQTRWSATYFQTSSHDDLKAKNSLARKVPLGRGAADRESGVGIEEMQRRGIDD